MEIQGKIIAVLALQTGEGKNGTWKKQDYVLETGDQYPKKICFNLWGDKIDQFQVAIDDVVNLSFDIESREFNGRWYTDVRGWKIDKLSGQAAAQQAPAASSTPTPPVNTTPFGGEDDNSNSDLPF